MNVGKGESLCQVSYAFRFHNGLFEDLPIEIHYGSIRFDSSRPYTCNPPTLLRERDLDVGVLTSVFGQYLDAKVIVFMGRAAVVVPVHLMKKKDGRRPRRHGLARHL